jgi:hypothetical protein
MKTIRIFAMVLAAGAVLVWLAATSQAADPAKPFSHKQHLEEGAECATCHKAVEGQALPVLNQEGCTDCHDDGAPAWTLPAKAARLPFAFPHALHAEAAECKDCHQAVAEETQAAGKLPVDHARCTACHQENDVAVRQCKQCHGVDATKVKPADHAQAWSRKHGEESRWRQFGQHGQDCSLCHRADGCQTCHKSARPRNHTGLWRTRTHGVAAGWDRDACKTCHETGACIRCHQTSQPLNHKGAWRSTHGLAAQSRSNEHCTTCHQLSWCAACHAGR